MEETGINMILHALIIGIITFILMEYGWKIPRQVAIDRSILIGSIALIYMVVFGHNMPSSNINPNIKIN